jgi:hypothetical protein
LMERSNKRSSITNINVTTKTKPVLQGTLTKIHFKKGQII